MKVLVLHASVGAGHRTAALALAHAFRARGVTTIVHDILEDTPPWFRRPYASGYLHLVRAAPHVWSYLYARTQRSAQRAWERRLRILFERLNAGRFLRRLRRERFDAVICTHFLPLELVSAMRDRPLLYGVVTDFHVHSLWIARPVDGYFVATPDAQRQLIRRGMCPESVRVTGIPVRPEFARPVSRLAARRRYGLDPARPAVLFLAGGFGVGPAVEFTQSLAGEGPDLQALIVVGRNERLRRRVARAAMGDGRIRVFGYVEDVAGMMDAVDLVATKPGGLTCAEALARGKPLLLVDPIPGHEQYNAEYLLEHGAAVRLFDVADAAHKIRILCGQPERLARLAAAALALGRPHAADDIAALVMENIAQAHSSEPEGRVELLR